VGVAGELRAAVAQQRREVERPLADERLRVDRQPRLALGCEEVAAVAVLMQDDVARRAGIIEEGDRPLDEPSVARPAVALPASR
jgi:hypothetical protein